MTDISKIIRRYKPLILNWFKAKKELSSGAVEGLNNKLKLTFRKTYGFKPIRLRKYSVIMHWGSYLNQNSPTDYFEEAKKQNLRG